MRNTALRRRNPGGRDYVRDGHRSQDGMRKCIKRNVDMAKNICKSWVRLYQHRRSRWNRLQHRSDQWSAENGPLHQYIRIILKTTQKGFARKTNTFWRNYPTMHRFLTIVSLHFRLDQKCMLVELGACVTECLKSFNSLGEFSMRCPRRTPTHFFVMCIWIVLNIFCILI